MLLSKAPRENTEVGKAAMDQLKSIESDVGTFLLAPPDRRSQNLKLICQILIETDQSVDNEIEKLQRNQLCRKVVVVDRPYLGFM